MKIEVPGIILIQVTREQNGYGPLFKAPYIIGTLSEGDYSIAGLEDRIALERKSLSDLVSSLTHDRNRFEKELAKTRSYHRFYVVCECSADDILSGRYRSEASPASIWESICAFSIRYCPFLFAGDRATRHACLTESLLLKFGREHIKAAHEMAQAARRIRKSDLNTSRSDFRNDN